MFYTWNEVAKWIHVTIFEIFTFFIALFAFSILLTIKVSVDDYSLNTENANLNASRASEPGVAFAIDWLGVFSPLFAFDIVSLYLCIIICIRQSQAHSIRSAVLRLFFNLQRIFLSFLIKYLVCNKLSNTTLISYSEILLPVLYMILILFCRSFKI